MGNAVSYIAGLLIVGNAVNYIGGLLTIEFLVTI
jgi:hypothetical protein